MDMIQIDPFKVFFAAVGLVIWFTRLEAKTNKNEKDIEKQELFIAKMKEKHETLESELIKELGEVKQALARIEGQLIGK